MFGRNIIFIYLFICPGSRMASLLLCYNSAALSAFIGNISAPATRHLWMFITFDCYIDRSSIAFLATSVAFAIAFSNLCLVKATARTLTCLTVVISILSYEPGFQYSFSSLRVIVIVDMYHLYLNRRIIQS